MLLMFRTLQRLHSHQATQTGEPQHPTAEVIKTRCHMSSTIPALRTGLTPSSSVIGTLSPGVIRSLSVSGLLHHPNS
ncbi:hypothetical protein V2G26_015165 [Clonostachys chloroleuca]